MRLLFGVVLSLCAVASLASFSYVDVTEPREVHPNWKLVGPAPDDHKIPIILALKQQNLDKLEEIFWEVSDPQHEKYGSFLTIEQLAELIGAEDETIELVSRWLHASGVEVEKVSGTKDFIHATATVASLQKMLHAEFHMYQHMQTSQLVVKTMLYSAPTVIANVLDYITGITGFPIEYSAQRSFSSEDQIPVTPAMLRQRYNVTTVGTSSKNSQSVAEFQGQYYSPSDLKQFFSTYVTNSGNYTVTKVMGSNNPDAPGVEASLDIQYIMGVAPNVPTWFWSTPGMDFWSALTQWASDLSSTPGSPYVHSISYGSQRAFEQPSTTQRTRVNAEFQKVGAMGQSIIFASGDSGVGCELCILFEPSFPATSPYVTSVGATRFIGSTVGPEAAVEAFRSGGGFSRHDARPSYQNDVVNKYFETDKDLPLRFYYHKEGRGTPDVAALGIGFQVIAGGGTESVGGTSASSPTFAAVISLLNEIRLAKGAAPLGFLNPWIYQSAASHPNAFYDVTIGSNPSGCCVKGFSCAPGWDPVTGLGTPNFDVLKTLV